MYIIYGNKKGRKIITPKRDFRPTQSKVREAFFNIVDIKDKTFLDLCSGIGGGRLDIEKAGLKSIGYSDTSKLAVCTYTL